MPSQKLQLLHGPYQTPAVRVGDRVACEYRGAECVVTSISAGRIQWPRGRVADAETGGGSGLLVFGDLARAVRTASAAAVCHWWGVSSKAVWHWRQALGVDRLNNTATNRLIRTSSKRGAEAVQVREFSEEERRRKAENARRLNLARHLHMNPRGDEWTAEGLALVGTLPDTEVARRIGRTVTAVRQKRYRQPGSEGAFWTAEELALLGTDTDEEVARHIGRKPSAVRQRRGKLKIPTFQDRRRKR
jgi:hypothetical protein